MCLSVRCLVFLLYILRHFFILKVWKAPNLDYFCRRFYSTKFIEGLRYGTAKRQEAK